VTIEAVGIASDAIIATSPYQNTVVFRDANVTAELRHGYVEGVEDTEQRDEIDAGTLEYAAAWHRTWRA
jgi:hypothetical protein